MLQKVFRPILKITKTSNVQTFKGFLNVKQAIKFSSAIEKVDKAQNKLSKALEREIKFEKENYSQDETVQEFLRDKAYALAEKEDDVNMELSKVVGKNKISILFQSRSPQAPEDEQGQEKEGGDQQTQDQQFQQQDDPQDMQDYCEFTVYIENPKGALVYECSSYDSEVTNDVTSHKSMTKLQRISHEYTGPSFNTLDERLQVSLIEYMKSMGIDEELAAFVEHVSLDKEQKLYIKWLEGVKNFVQ